MPVSLGLCTAVTENAASGACPREPCNVITTYTYDRAGNRTSIVDANSHTRMFVYDAANRPTSEFDALNQETQYEYDAAGRVLVTHDPRGSDFDLAYSYDEADRTTEIASNELAAPIQSAYDALGRRLALVDATGTTSFSYDALSRILEVNAPDTGTVGYVYDARGLRTQLTYADSTQIGYTYFPDGRLETVQHDTETLASYSYDAAGRMAEVVRSNGATTAYEYDNADRLQNIHTTVASATVSEFHYTTDRRGLRVSVDETWQARDYAGTGSGTGLEGDYFSDTSLSTLVLTRTDSLVDFNWGYGSPDTSVMSDTFSVRWTGTIQPLYSENYTFTTNAGDGVRLWVNGEQLIDDWYVHSTEAHSGMTSIPLIAGQHYTITLEYFEDTNDAEIHLFWSSARQTNEIIPTSQLYLPGVTDPQPLLTSTYGRTIDYAYDGLQRLAEAAESPGAVYTYTYDLVGNRTDVWQNGSLSSHREYDDTNQVSGWTYDGAGNLLNDGTTTYTYDALNRVTTLDSTTNTYNGDGVLFAQTTGSTTTNYTQDLAAPLSQILSDGTNRYVYGNPAERLFGVAGSTRTWYASDALGSVRATLDDAGITQAVANYDPWGVPETSAIAPFGFTGELQQGNNVYLRARWYGAQNGAFTARDPFEGMPERPYSLMPYQFIQRRQCGRIRVGHV